MLSSICLEHHLPHSSLGTGTRGRARHIGPDLLIQFVLNGILCQDEQK